jgi:hypothetical protein
LSIYIFHAKPDEIDDMVCLIRALVYTTWSEELGAYFPNGTKICQSEPQDPTLPNPFENFVPPAIINDHTPSFIIGPGIFSEDILTSRGKWPRECMNSHIKEETQDCWKRYSAIEAGTSAHY